MFLKRRICHLPTYWVFYYLIILQFISLICLLLETWHLDFVCFLSLVTWLLCDYFYHFKFPNSSRVNKTLLTQGSSRSGEWAESGLCYFTGSATFGWEGDGFHDAPPVWWVDWAGGWLPLLGGAAGWPPVPVPVAAPTLGGSGGVPLGSQVVVVFSWLQRSESCW